MIIYTCIIHKYSVGPGVFLKKICFCFYTNAAAPPLKKEKKIRDYLDAISCIYINKKNPHYAEMSTMMKLIWQNIRGGCSSFFSPQSSVCRCFL